MIRAIPIYKATDAGIKAAQYPYIVTMDGDLQNDPSDVPRLVQHLEENEFDVVSGWRKDRKDPFSKKFVSRVANLLRKVLVKDDIHDSGCTLKIYKKECFENIHLYGEMHRFIPALLKMRGFQIGELPVNHRPREAGKTKYNFKIFLVFRLQLYYFLGYKLKLPPIERQNQCL